MYLKNRWIAVVIAIYTFTISYQIWAIPSCLESDSYASQDVVIDESIVPESLPLEVWCSDANSNIVFLPNEKDISTQKTTLRRGQSTTKTAFNDGRIGMTIQLAPGLIERTVPLGFCLQTDDNNCQLLKVWDSQSKQYTEVLPTKIGNTVETSLYVDLLIPPDLVAELKPKLQTPQEFTIRASIANTTNPEKAIGIVVGQVNLVDIPESAQEKRTRDSGTDIFTQDFEKKFANKQLGVVAKGEGTGTINKDTLEASAELIGEGDVIIFGNEFTLVTSTANSELTMDEFNATVESDVLGYTVLSEGYDYCFTDETSCSSTNDSNDSSEEEETNNYEKEVSKEYKAIIFVSVVAVEVTAGISAICGIDWGFSVDVDNLSSGEVGMGFEVTPYIEIETYVNVSLNLIFLGAGPKGELSLLRDDLTGSITAYLSNDSYIEGNLTNNLTGPTGDIGPEAWWYQPTSSPPFFEKKTSYRPLVTWTLYEREDLLLSWDTREDDDGVEQDDLSELDEVEEEEGAFSWYEEEPEGDQFDQSKNWVCLYEREYYTGAKFCFSVKDDENTEISHMGDEGWQDTASSIKVWGGIKITLYEKENFDTSKPYIVLIGGYSDSGDAENGYEPTGGLPTFVVKDLRGDISSLIAEPYDRWDTHLEDEFCVYADNGLKGDKKCYPDEGNVNEDGYIEESDLSIYGWNDNISSISIQGNIKAYLYKNNEFDKREDKLIPLVDFGETLIGRMELHNMGGDWDNKISSLKVGARQNDVEPSGEDFEESKEWICVYAEENYEGEIFCYAIGGEASISTFEDAEWNGFELDWENKISSVKIWGGAQAYLYKDKDYKGDYMRVVGIGQDDSDSPTAGSPTMVISSLENEVSSVTVDLYTYYTNTYFDNKASVYEDEASGGDKEDYGIGAQIGKLSDSDWNDRVSSLLVQGDTSVFFYEKDNYEGDKITVASDYRGKVVLQKVKDAGWDNKISSLRVGPNSNDHEPQTEDFEHSENWVCIYEHTDYQGETLCFAVEENFSISNLDQVDWKDKISSVKIWGSVEVTLYENADYKADYMILSGAYITGTDEPTAGTPSMVTSDLDDGISSMEVKIISDWTAPLSDEVCFFEDYDFEGDKSCYTSPTNLLDLKDVQGDGDDWNDRISGILAQGELAGYFYTDKDYEGTDSNLVPEYGGRIEINDVGSGFNDKYSSIYIEERPSVIYEDDN